MTIELPRELEELVRSRLLDQDEDERQELQQAVEEGLRDIERGDYAEYDEHTIKDLAKDVHERGLKRIADL